MNEVERGLGTVDASEKLISELYIELRRKINRWAGVTNQTAQARMGYVGQHLVNPRLDLASRADGSRFRLLFD
jgi:hypothetical protein